jgi:hypothetical protein
MLAVFDFPESVDARESGQPFVPTLSVDRVWATR